MCRKCGLQVTLLRFECCATHQTQFVSCELSHLNILKTHQWKAILSRFQQAVQEYTQVPLQMDWNDLEAYIFKGVCLPDTIYIRPLVSRLQSHSLASLNRQWQQNQVVNILLILRSVFGTTLNMDVIGCIFKFVGVVKVAHIDGKKTWELFTLFSEVGSGVCVKYKQIPFYVK